MKTQRREQVNVGIVLVSGTITCFFGLFGCLTLLGPMLTFGHVSWFDRGYPVVPGMLNLATAIVSAYACYLGLDSQPTARWTTAGLVLAALTLVVTNSWWPYYYFIGM